MSRRSVAASSRISRLLLLVTPWRSTQASRLVILRRLNLQGADELHGLGCLAFTHGVIVGSHYNSVPGNCGAMRETNHMVQLTGV
jgi:hypothetical protein